MTQFSVFFDLLLSHNKSINITNTCSMLFHWNHPQGRKQSYYTKFCNGYQKPAPALYDDFDNNKDAFDIVSKVIAKDYCSTIDSKADLIHDMINMLDSFSIPKEEVYFIVNHFSNDLPMFITCVFFLSVTERKELPGKIKEKYNNARTLNEENQAFFQIAMWNASRNSFFSSRRDGHRFESLHKITHLLLPKGYINQEQLNWRFTSSDTHLQRIDDIYNSSAKNIIIIGEGGIGKTTFLHELMCKSFGTERDPREYNIDEAIPLFIELNRCPNNIVSWYDNYQKKSNFITRYIADMIQTTYPEKYDYNTLLTKIESEFKRISVNPKYILLLDGYNEVPTDVNSNGESARAILSNEIRTLSNYDNIRIITTSRKTKSDPYSANSVKVNLIGLEEEDIEKHLLSCNYLKEEINKIRSNQELMHCLSIPLFLLLFSARKDGSHVPNSRGEILYQFFHSSDSTYNIYLRSNDSYNNVFNHSQKALELLLHFVVPYLGNVYVNNNTFSLTKKELENYIGKVLSDLTAISESIYECDLIEFNYDISTFKCAVSSLCSAWEKSHRTIVSAITDSLCIMYEYDTNETDGIPLRYSFIHHYYRDYFSAIWHINCLRLLHEVNYRLNKSLILDSLQKEYWTHSEQRLIGQILLEHEYRPQLNEFTENWELPVPRSKRQVILSNALSFCRGKAGWSILIQNIINTLRYARTELAGIDFSNLDLRENNLFDICMSKKGKSSFLACKFDGSKFSEYTFSPTTHSDMIAEHLYTDKYYITIDSRGYLRIANKASKTPILFKSIWSTDSIYWPKYASLKVSNDESTLCIRTYYITESYRSNRLHIYHLNSNSGTVYHVAQKDSITTIIDFTFTPDSSTLLFTDDSCLYSVHGIQSPPENGLSYDVEKVTSYKEIIDDASIFVQDEQHGSHIILSEYREITKNTFDDFFDYLMNHDKVYSVRHSIYYYAKPNNLTLAFSHDIPENITRHYCDAYFQRLNCILLFPYLGEYALFDCESKKIKTVLSQIPKPKGTETLLFRQPYVDSNTLFIIVGTTCYHVMVTNDYQATPIATYHAPTVNLPEFDYQEFEFNTFTTPYFPHFILTGNHPQYPYEFDVESGETAPLDLVKSIQTKVMFCDNENNIIIFIHENGLTVTVSQKNHSIVNMIQCNEFNRSSEVYYSSINKKLICISQFDALLSICLINPISGLTEFKRLDIPSSSYPHFTLSSDEDHLLIWGLSFCIEYNYINEQVATIESNLSNETIVSALYHNNNVILCSVKSPYDNNPSEAPLCKVFRKINRKSYSLSYCYYVPILPRELCEEFVIEETHDFTHNEYISNNGPCTIAKGCFIDNASKYKDMIRIEKIKIAGSTSKPYDYTLPNPLQPLFVLILNDYKFKDARIDRSTQNEITVHSDQHIFYYKKTKQRFKLTCTFNLTNVQNNKMPIIQFIKPGNNNILYCFDNNNYTLYCLASNDKSFNKMLQYYPGIIILGCSFQRIDAPDDCKMIIAQNGGILE